MASARDAIRASTEANQCGLSPSCVGTCVWTKFLPEFSAMDATYFAKRIDKLISELQQLREELAAGEPEFPEWAEDLVQKRTCLGCRKKIAAGERVFRGNHEKHYRQVLRAINKGETTEHAAIEAGLLTPTGWSGHANATTGKTDAIRKHLELQAQAEVDELEADLRKKRG